MSALLVPSCGAWLGASTPSNDGRSTTPSGWPSTRPWPERARHPCTSTSATPTPFPTADEIALSERPGKQRSLLFYNWKPSTTLTWRRGRRRGADDTIAAVAASISRYPHRLFLAIYHEPENDELRRRVRA